MYETYKYSKKSTGKSQIALDNLLQYILYEAVLVSFPRYMCHDS